MTTRTDIPATPRTDGRGMLAAVGAFIIWGLLPIYLKQLQDVPVLQVTAHRLIWGCTFALCWLALRRELPQVWAALADPKVRCISGKSMRAETRDEIRGLRRCSSCPVTSTRELAVDSTARSTCTLSRSKISGRSTLIGSGVLPAD